MDFTILSKSKTFTGNIWEDWGAETMKQSTTFFLMKKKDALYHNMIYLLDTFGKLILMNRIKEVLNEKGLKQAWLAKRLHKSYNMVNVYVQNRRQPSLEDLYRIAEILGIDVRYLLKRNKTK